MTTGEARVIDGNALASEARAGIPARVERLRRHGVTACLDAVLVESGDNAARVYAERQAETCRSLGIEYRLHTVGAGCGAEELCGVVERLSGDAGVHALMLHMPVPEGVDAFEVKRRIAPEKDVEGVNPLNIGAIVYGHSSIAPCTALATVRLIESTGVRLRGARAVVIGAGDVVGKPIAVLLMRQEATVISCNKDTWGLSELARTADVLVAAAGVPELVPADWIKPGAVVVDVGVNRVTGSDGKRRTVGDVAYERARRVAGWISPVPGGVGPMTVAMLLLNVVDAAERAAGVS